MTEAKRLLGIEFSLEETVSVLEEIGCSVSKAQGDVLLVTPPTWRSDITIPADLVEELARILGYDKIPSILPTLSPNGENNLTQIAKTKRKVSDALSVFGLVETASYPFVGKKQLDLLYGANTDTAQAQALADLKRPSAPAQTLADSAPDSVSAQDLRHLIELKNPLSKDKPYLRTSLLQTTLETVIRNVRRGNEEVNLFEVGSVSHPNEHTNSSFTHLVGGALPTDAQLSEIQRGLPYQPIMVAGVFAGEFSSSGDINSNVNAQEMGNYKDAFNALDLVCKTVGAEVSIQKCRTYELFHLGRAAKILTSKGLVAGYAGQLNPSVTEALGLPESSAAFELNLQALVDSIPTTEIQAKLVSHYPVVKEDLAFVVSKEVEAQSIKATIESVSDIVSARVFDVFEGGNLEDVEKSITFSVRMRPNDKTLTADEVRSIRKKIISSVEQKHAAHLRN
jgi:phenylalanyl-tRNA synthetase beta chain